MSATLVGISPSANFDRPDVTATLPSGWAVDDTLFAFVYVRGGGTITAPSGWTLENSDSSSSFVQYSLYSKQAEAGETNPTFTVPGQTVQPVGAIIIALRDYGTITYNTTRIASGSNIIWIDDAVAPDDDNLVILFLAAADNNSVVSDPSGYTQAFYDSTSLGSDTALVVWTGAQDAGTVAPPDAVMNASDASLTKLMVVGPAPTNVAPVSGISADMTTNVTPGTTVTLTLTDSDSDGTVVSRNFRQISGTTVATSGTPGNGAAITFTAPPTLSGDTLVFGYKVTDDGGAESTEATVSITVLPAPARMVVDGSEVAVSMYVYYSGS